MVHAKAQRKFEEKRYKARIVGGEVAEDLFDRGICLPSGTAMRDADMDRLKTAYNEMVDFWGGIGELTYYQFARRVPDRPPKAYQAVRWLKSVLLFRV